MQLRLGCFNFHLFRDKLALGLGALLGKLVLALLKLGLLAVKLRGLLPAFLQALFHLIAFFCQFGFRVCKGALQLLPDSAVYLVNLILPQPYLHAFLHIAADADAGHALNALQLHQQLCVQQVCQGHVVHALHLHCGYSYRQHVGIDFHDVRSAHCVGPAAGNAV